MTEPRREETLPAVHVLHLVSVAARWNVTARELLEPAGLKEADLADPRARLPLATVEDLVARARALTGEPGIGVHLGLEMRASAHGYLGFAAMTSATLGEAIAVAMRFIPTRTTVFALRLQVEGEVAALIVEERAPLGTARDVLVLAVLLGIWQVGEAITGRDLGGSIDIALPEPSYWRRFRDVASPVRFDAPAHQLVFDAKLLSLPLAMADPAAERLAREQCERELEVRGSERVASDVQRLLPIETGGFQSLEVIARELHMSPRTLKRALAREGTSYSRLRDQQRKDRAILLLRAPDLTLETVAERVGYSDVANFTRAFRRWTGSTPRARRPPGPKT